MCVIYITLFGNGGNKSNIDNLHQHQLQRWKMFMSFYSHIFLLYYCGIQLFPAVKKSKVINTIVKMHVYSCNVK